MEKKEIIAKLKALSDRGIGGEKENATMLLNKLMKKYGITEEELQSEETKKVWISLKNDVEKKICNQILYAYFNDAGLWQRKNDRTKYFTKLTVAQEIEFKYMLSVYLKDFYEEQDIFITAFIKKNNIFPVNGPILNIDELTKEERKRNLRVLQMAGNIERTQIRKALNA